MFNKLHSLRFCYFLIQRQSPALFGAGLKVKDQRSQGVQMRQFIRIEDLL
jgi:hypothetical protein